VKPFQDSTCLITGGMFSYSRNPMYLGFVSILIGIATLFGSLSPCFVVPLFVILMDRIFIQVEEHMLEVQFGLSWLEYKAKVGCW
jgi:protein-S-isoprenylcysteine O-methyltransferase Ste14